MPFLRKLAPAIVVDGTRHYRLDFLRERVCHDSVLRHYKPALEINFASIGDMLCCSSRRQLVPEATLHTIEAKCGREMAMLGAYKATRL